MHENVRLICDSRQHHHSDLKWNCVAHCANSRRVQGGKHDTTLEIVSWDAPLLRFWAPYTSDMHERDEKQRKLAVTSDDSWASIIKVHCTNCTKYGECAKRVHVTDVDLHEQDTRESVPIKLTPSFCKLGQAKRHRGRSRRRSIQKAAIRTWFECHYASSRDAVGENPVAVSRKPLLGKINAFSRT